MKMLKTIRVFILLFTVSHRAELCPPVMFERPCGISWNFCLNRRGYLCNAQSDVTPHFSFGDTSLVPAKGGTEKSSWETSATSLPRSANETQGNGHVTAEISLPTLVVAGVSIALVLLCILIVAIFWYAWKKSQEGSMQLNPIPYGETVVSLRNPWVPESQQEWPSETAVP